MSTPAPGVAIKPPFGCRANAVTARSISPASRVSIGRGSTPRDGATDWMLPNSDLRGDPGIPHHRHAHHPRRNLFEQFQPLCSKSEFRRGKSGGVAAGPRQTRN
jgi:hypothetical protein